MRHSTDFASVVRRGTRIRGGRLVVHHRLTLESGPGERDVALVGLVVSRSVGGSVVRHQVSRRLRAQLAQRLTTLPPGSGTVIRALPEAASASSSELGADLDRALARLARHR